MKVIVNADDFGVNGIVTSEIERMINLGCVTSTTIMANGLCLDEVRKFAGRNPQVSYGVHLCLSEFESITHSPVLYKYGITDTEGRFVRMAIFKVKHFNEELKSALKDELDAQIEVVKSLDIPLSHCDSHHHVHTIYQLREVFSEVLRQQGFSKIRRAYEYGTLRMKLHLFSWQKQMKVNKFYSDMFTTAQVFLSYSEFCHNPKDVEIAELMCHPGHPGDAYKKEMGLVENKTIFKMAPDVELITYNDIH